MEFYVRGVRVRFTFGFFAVWAVILIQQSSGSAAAAMSLAACLLHEAGHLLAMRLCGARAERIVFYSGGIALKRRTEPCGGDTAGELFILAGGCFVNLILFIVSSAAGARLFAMINLMLMLFNLLPLPSLDGGRIIMTVAERTNPASDVSHCMRGIELVFGAAAVVFFLSKGSVSFTLPLTLAMIVIEGVIDRSGEL